MELIISGIISLIIAVLVGAYRQFCITMEVKAQWNIPMIWRYSFARFLSWIIVAVSSIGAAFVFVGIFSVIFNDFIGKFSFGVVLLIRWVISGQLGVSKANKALAAERAFEGTEEYKEILDEGERMKEEYIAKQKQKQ